MNDWLVYFLIALFVAFILVIAFVVGIVFLLKPKGIPLIAVLRLVPNIFGLFKRLVREQGFGKTVALGLIFLAVYLVSPVDVIPDVIPLLGSADDAAMFVLVLRAALVRAGPDLLRSLWPGNEASLEILRRVFRLR